MLNRSALSASAATILASLAGATPVATFTYTNVGTYADPDAPVAFTEAVTATDQVGSVIFSGTLTSIVGITWGMDATINVYASDGQFITFDPFPNATTYGSLTLDPTPIVLAAPVASAAGSWTFEFLDTFADGDVGFPDAQWDTITIVLEGEGAGDPPACPTALATATFTNVTSDTFYGGGGANSIVTHNFNVAGPINTFRITGQLVASDPSYRSESRLYVTAPSGNSYVIPAMGLPLSPGVSNLDAFEYLLPQGESGTGDWTIEFYESFDDDISPDATWTSICIGVDATATDPTATAIANPPYVLNTGGPQSQGLFIATIVPGEVPTSTFNASGSVIVDASGIGLANITLLDNGVAPDTVANDLVFTGAYAVSASAAEGEYILPLTAIDDQGRTATANVALTVAGAAPGCASGVGSFTIANAVSNAGIGDPDNTIITIDPAIASDVNQIRVSGRLFAFTPSWRADAAIHLIAPDSTEYFLTGLAPTNSGGLADVTDYVADLGAAINANGTWTVEFYEAFSDGAVNPDTLWTSACITFDASGACCTSSGCSIMTVGECNAAGGTFQGAATNCGVPSYEMTTSTSLFEDISAVGTLLANSDSDDATASAEIGFTFNFLGNDYTSVNVSSNGNIQFPDSNSAVYVNTPIPDVDVPNNMLAPFWDDFNALTSGDIYAYTDSSGGAGNARFIVSWQNIAQYANTDSNSFQVVLFENGSFEFRYGAITPEAFAGDYTVGYENIDGTFGAEIAAADLGAGDTARLFSFVPATNPCDGGSSCPDCAADYDLDGGVTGGDIGAFFSDFEQGLPCADVDLDGGITGGDIGAFFQVFEAGGC